MNAQIEVQEFEIDAQVDWKIMYSHFKCVTRFSYRRKIRRAMRAVRREAALERIIARLMRENEAQARRIEAQQHMIGTLATLVRLKYGNLDKDINEILSAARKRHDDNSKGA